MCVCVCERERERKKERTKEGGVCAYVKDLSGTEMEKADDQYTVLTLELSKIPHVHTNLILADTKYCYFLCQFNV